MRYYKCTDIETVDGTPYNSCVVSVPAIDLSDPLDRCDNLVAISGALENIVGEVNRFSYTEVYNAN